MKELLNSTCLENILGILSLLIGCYSIYLTKKVDQKAQEFKNNLRELKKKQLLRSILRKLLRM